MKQRVLLVDENDGRAVLLVEALQEAGYEVVGRFCVDEDILKNLGEQEVDLLVINVSTPGKLLLNQLNNITEWRSLPIVMFADRSESPIINAAVKAGVSAIVVDGLARHRIRPVLDVAIARFEETSVLRLELRTSRENLENRKLVDQAKAIIMKRKKMDEDGAYKELRSMAMNQNMRIHEVAKNIVSVAHLLT